MASASQVFNKKERVIFDSCCQYFEFALAHFNYNSQVQCYVNQDNEVVLYGVNISYEGQQHQAFTALTLDEFYKKMELIYQLYLYSKEHQCDIEHALNHFLEQYESFVAVQGEIDDLLNWCEFIDEELGKHNSFSYDMMYKENRTLH
ncbi:hypothetical protein [Facilibium subflavum]|uniref:hypothetical protein n=1 Tax=Facilibium subflavum TaxID=2219058 RepID=UPI000E657F52|nr:hypothetical protein [Facilibium subflavum]